MTWVTQVCRSDDSLRHGPSHESESAAAAAAAGPGRAAGARLVCQWPDSETPPSPRH